MHRTEPIPSRHHGFIAAPDGQIHITATGSYLGSSWGKVMDMDAEALQLVEEYQTIDDGLVQQSTELIRPVQKPDPTSYSLSPLSMLEWPDADPVRDALRAYSTPIALAHSNTPISLPQQELDVQTFLQHIDARLRAQGARLVLVDDSLLVTSAGD